MQLHTAAWAELFVQGKEGEMLAYSKSCSATESPQAHVNPPGSVCRLMPSWHSSLLQLEASTTEKLALEMVTLRK